jgi:hypothetical protein
VATEDLSEVRSSFHLPTDSKSEPEQRPAARNQLPVHISERNRVGHNCNFEQADTFVLDRLELGRLHFDKPYSDIRPMFAPQILLERESIANRFDSMHSGRPEVAD